MKTKLFKTLAATAMSVLAIACAKEPVADNGQQAGVSFEIENPVVISKAGEGTTATQLYYQVFTADGQLIAGLPAQSKPLSSLKTTVTFQLVKDQTYKFIFWAQTPTAGYYSFAGTDDAKDIRTVTANYEGKAANDENFDAFFATESFKVTGPVTKTVTLKRPFAQINIGTKDQLKAGGATAPAIDFTGAKSSVTVKGVPTVFSPLAATPETMLTVPATVTFASAAIPTGLLKVNETDYNYLAMNYVFAPAEGTVCDLSAEIALTGREPIQLSSPTTPIKRNWRTNILGSLLTSSVDYDVVVDPVFGGDDVPREGYKADGTVQSLPEGPVKEGNVWKVNAENYQYTLDGAYGSIDGKTIHFTESVDEPIVFGRPTKFSASGTKYMVGGFDASEAHFKEFATAEELAAYKALPGWTPVSYYTRTIENVTLTADEGVTINGLRYNSGHINGTAKPIYDYVRDTGVWCTSSNDSHYFAAFFKNISFVGITFSAYVNLENSQSLTDFDGITFKNCSFCSGTTHSSQEAKMCIRIGNWTNPSVHNFKNLVVDNCSFKDSAQGVYCNAVYGVKVINSTFENLIGQAVSLQTSGVSEGYGVSEISNNTFKDITDRIIRINKLSADTELTIKGNVSTNSGRLSDGKRLVMKAEGLEDGIVYHISGNDWNGGDAVIENEELKDYDWTKHVAQDNATVKLEAGTYTLPSTVGDGVTIAGPADGSVVIDMENKAVNGYSDVSFKNISFKMGTENYKGFQGSGTLKFDSCSFEGLHFGYGAKEIYTNCTFNQSSVEYNMWTYGANVDYIGCTFKGKGKFLHVYNEGLEAKTINIKNCKFINTGDSDKPAINIKGTCGAKALLFTVNIDGCTVEGNFPSINGGLWQVDKAATAENNQVTVKVNGTKVYLN